VCGCLALASARAPSRAATRRSDEVTSIGVRGEATQTVGP
jgi:hypothetical protein